MIQNVKLIHSDTVYGYCDGDTIWITDGKLHYKNIVGTLLHEALHNTVSVKGQGELTEDQEHDAMHLLGDWYARGVNG